MARYLLAQHHLLTGSTITSVTSEAGPTIGPPVESSVSGNLKLGASGQPAAAINKDLYLQNGGNPTGFDAAQAGAGAGAELLWSEDGEASSLDRGWQARDYLTWVDCPPQQQGSASIKYGWQSPARTLGNGSVGFVAYRNGSVTDSIRFLHKSTRTGTWTNVTVFTTGDDGLTITQADHRPGLVVLPGGRLICYILTDYAGSGNAVASYFSDDDGATWALYRKVSAVVNGSYDIINAETVDGEVVLVLGDKSAAGLSVYHSTSGGVGFIQKGAAQSGYARPNTCVTNAGLIVVVADDDDATTAAAHVAILAPGGRLDSSEFWTAQTILDGSANFNNIALCSDERGTVWIFVNAQQSVGPIQQYYSTDGGLTWVQNNTSYFVTRFYGSGGNDYLAGITAGLWYGELILLGRGTPAGGTAGTLYSLWFGGWSATAAVERPLADNFGGPYNMTYVPMELPTGLGWSKADSGTGATITLSGGAINIVADGSGNSLYSAPSSWTADIDDNGGFRKRFLIRVNSGGTSGRRALIEAGITDTTNIQSVQVRLSATTMYAYDGAGNSLGSSAPLADFTSWTEVFVAFEHETATNTGTVTVAHRVAGQTIWTKVCDGATVAETAGAANILNFGGDSNGAVDWDLILLEVANDHAGVASWTVPDDLVGRPVGVEGMYLDQEDAKVHGFGTGGVTGDQWDYKTTAKYPATYMVDTDSPLKHWRSTNDSADNAIVFDAGANGLWMGNLWMLCGTNFRDATLQFNSSDSWGSPSATINIDADIAENIAFSARGKGYIKSSTLTDMVLHQYASREGRRYFLRFQTSGTTYEITDNNADHFFFDGQDMSAEVGLADLFGDGMYNDTSQVTGYRYMRILVAAQDTSDEYFQIGRFQAGHRLSMTDDGTEYDKGFQDVTAANVDIQIADGGAVYASELGPDRRSLLVRWHPAYRSSTPIDVGLEALYRRLGGPENVVGFVRDSTLGYLADNGGIYRIRGKKMVRANVFDEGASAITKVESIELVEER